MIVLDSANLQILFMIVGIINGTESPSILSYGYVLTLYWDKDKLKQVYGVAWAQFLVIIRNTINLQLIYHSVGL